MTRARGDWAEQRACDFLQAQGLTPLARNVHCRFGEVDLVMQASNQLVFVEVKYRRSGGFGGASAAVTPAKQQKLRLAAQWYLQQHGWEDRPCRFDVVAMTGEHIDWIENAF
ncbi:YraN family protein [Ferrimonas marina]|uniref:UPF0102 protein SAMN02745129_3518 n=1 Tax=Ferrimonas marina TaxID=299255 RepID=A0A1M5XG35_9GAMM|nr:YraN family protein [Ferrimonas marina]SHH98807.1 putative endonuclease [Ferrimonas marina]